MIELHLGLYEGDINVIPFNNLAEIIDYIEELIQFDCVWVVCDDSDDYERSFNDGHIMVSERIDFIKASLSAGMFVIKDRLHIQEYQSYEAAYAVALSMREGNKKCYDLK